MPVVNIGMTLGRVGLVVPYDFARKMIEVCEWPTPRGFSTPRT